MISDTLFAQNARDLHPILLKVTSLPNYNPQQMMLLNWSWQYWGVGMLWALLLDSGIDKPVTKVTLLTTIKAPKSNHSRRWSSRISTLRKTTSSEHGKILLVVSSRKRNAPSAVSRLSLVFISTRLSHDQRIAHQRRSLKTVVTLAFWYLGTAT